MGYMKRQDKREAQAERANGYKPDGTMHPPTWNENHRLLDWPGCWLELRCVCQNLSVYPVKLMAKRHGNRTFRQVLAAVRCSKCRRIPFSIFLCASPHRVHGSGGPPPDWAIELKPPQWVR